MYSKNTTNYFCIYSKVFPTTLYFQNAPAVYSNVLALSLVMSNLLTIICTHETHHINSESIFSETIHTAGTSPRNKVVLLTKGSDHPSGCLCWSSFMYFGAPMLFLLFLLIE